MNNRLYAKLAATNVKKNRQTYIPYMLTCICTIAMFYMIHAVSINEGLREMKGSAVIGSILSLGTIVIGFFSIIFLFYTNSFLMKRRKKEFGLYNILGMEKRHIFKIIFFETLYTALGTLILGILFGMLASKLMYMLLLRLLGHSVPLGYNNPPASIAVTCGLFGVIFLATLLNSLRQVQFANPIELLQGGNVGEKEPKTKWGLALIGLVTLGTGYFMSVTVKNPIEALMVFFTAVILVIIGTYCLFTAGSIVLLKMLRKNRTYYYKTSHFISVSGMIYRMKQNAVGLANICILSTMVLVMLSTTVCLYAGSEDSLKTRYPDEIIFSIREGQVSQSLKDMVQDTLNEMNLTEATTCEYSYLSFGVMNLGDRFTLNREAYGMENIGNVWGLKFMTAQDFNTYYGTDLGQPGEGQVYVIDPNNKLNLSQFKLDDALTWDVLPAQEMNTSISIMGPESADITETAYIIVKDMEALRQLDEIQALEYEENRSTITGILAINTNADEDVQMALYENLQKKLETTPDVGFPGYIESRADNRMEIYAINGGFFFLGAYLGLLFLMAAALIIYYKQISEGYDDKNRFEIMQKVGLSKREVKSTIHSQIMTMFFLPLVTAGIHVLFAFPVISKLLMALNIYNTALFSLCLLGCFLVFAVFYSIIYTVTARVYYKIVD